MLQTRQTRGWTDHHHARAGRRPSTDSNLLLLPTSYFVAEGTTSTSPPASTTEDEDGKARRKKLFVSSQQNVKAVAVLSRKSSMRAVTHIPELPPSFFNYFEHITSLRLGCGLRRLPPHIARLKELRSLDLRGNRLKALPYQIKAVNLQQLIVDDVVTADFSELMLTDFVRKIPSDESAESDGKEETGDGQRQQKRTPMSPSLQWLGGPATLKETALRVVLSSIALPELDVPGESGTLLSFVPPHLRPRVLPPDECAFCGRTVIELLDQAEFFHSDETHTTHTRRRPRPAPKRYRIEVVALRKVVLESVFCGRRCLLEMEKRWRDEDLGEQIKVIQRGMRFMGVAHVAMA
ncbi:hypothetical protein BZA70DRAFT_279554 [Myxozyma melibiosi]|uniref:Uncharacterized protein n=1 Tax=Myxozyma melibiosi TaxID=54550 RepID=A0ABR1F469_9ASCO